MSTKRPNVIVFFTDQQRWDTCGAHGNPLGLTPNYDRLAARGTHARLAFTPQPVCGPSRSCLQTGLYATQTGCYRNNIPLRPEARTLAHHFRGGGYTTGYIGKWHLAAGGEGPVSEPARGGYEYWLAANALEMTSDAYSCVVYDNDGRAVRLPGYRVDALNDAAIRYIDTRARGEQPFFLFLSFLEPHHQNHRDDYPAPDLLIGRYQGRGLPADLAALGGTAPQHWDGYCGMVRRLDEALGRLLDALKSLGQLENTIIAFTSDHGCHFKTRNREYKRTGHDASTRVPLALHGGLFTGGGDIDRLVNLVDLPPTLLDAAGLPIPPAMMGRSLLPLLRGGRVRDWPREVFAQTSEHEHGRVLRTHRWKYGVVAPGLAGDEGPYASRYDEAYLYDLLADPAELTNLIGFESHRMVTDHLRERLAEWMRRVGEPPAEFHPALVRPSGQRCVRPGEERE